MRFFWQHQFIYIDKLGSVVMKFNLQCSSGAFVLAAFWSSSRSLWSRWSNRFLLKRNLKSKLTNQNCLIYCKPLEVTLLTNIFKAFLFQLLNHKRLGFRAGCSRSSGPTCCCFRGRPLPLRWGSSVDWAALDSGDGSLVPLLLMSASVHLLQRVCGHQILEQRPQGL